MSTLLHDPAIVPTSEAAPLPALRSIAHDRGLHVEEMICPVCGRESKLYAVSHVPETGGCQFVCVGSSLEEAYTNLFELLDEPAPEHRVSGAEC